MIHRRVPGDLKFAYEVSTSSSEHHLRLIAETLGQMVQSGSMSFGLQAETETGKIPSQEIVDA